MQLLTGLLCNPITYYSVQQIIVNVLIALTSAGVAFFFAAGSSSSLSEPFPPPKGLTLGKICTGIHFQQTYLFGTLMLHINLHLGYSVPSISNSRKKHDLYILYDPKTAKAHKNVFIPVFCFSCSFTSSGGIPSIPYISISIFDLFGNEFGTLSIASL